MRSEITIGAGVIPITSGHVITNLTDVNFLFDLEFTTQDAKFVEGTGKKAGKEMSPAIDILNLELSLDKADSEITVGGFYFSSWYNKVLDLYKSHMFDRIIERS